MAISDTWDVDSVVIPSEANGVSTRGLLVAALALALADACAAFYFFGRPVLIAQGLANLTSDCGVANTTTPPSVCGPWPHGAAGDHAFGAYNAYLPRHIAEYAVGAPRWGAAVVTVPLRFRLVSWDEDGTGVIHVPARMDRLDGPGVYDATITLRWTGLGSGGWAVAGAETHC